MSHRSSFLRAARASRFYHPAPLLLSLTLCSLLLGGCPAPGQQGAEQAKNKKPATQDSDPAGAVPAVDEAAVRRNAAAQLERLGASILGPPDAPTHVYLPGKPVKSVMSDIAALRSLVLLDLSRSQLDDVDLTYIEPLEKLEYLVIDNTQVTPAGIDTIVKLPDLHAVHLNGLPIGRPELEKLSQLERVTELGLAGSRLSDADMDYLAGEFPELEVLNLYGCAVGDTGLAALQELDRMRELYLSETAVSDKGMTGISKLSKLEALWLSGTGISDASVPEMVKLKNLTDLRVDGTQLTPEGVSRLRQALPKCEVIGSGI